MEPFLKALKLEINCEACGGKVKQSIEWIRENKEFSCPCGHVVHLDAASFEDQITEAENRFKAMQATVKNLGK